MRLQGKVAVVTGSSMGLGEAIAGELQQTGGVIINLGSIYSHVGNRFRAAYIASKHGVSGLTKALASEWAPHHIRVLEVCPAYIQTPMIQTDLQTGAVDAELFFTDSDIQRRTPLGRFGVPDEVTKVVSFLASERGVFHHWHVGECRRRLGRVWRLVNLLRATGPRGDAPRPCCVCVLPLVIVVTISELKKYIYQLKLCGGKLAGLEE